MLGLQAKKKIAKVCIYLAIGIVVIIVVVTSGGRNFGGTASAEAIVQVALGEYGTVGGDKYRRWHWGTADGEPWCASFVSWCADQCGLIELGVIPKFEGCIYGVQWFSERGLFYYTPYYGGVEYIPKTGDIIFFSGTRNKDISSHVGIVQYVEGGRVITIEGNTSNSVLERSYDLTDSYVLGYATPEYPALIVGDSDFTGNTNAEIAWNYFKSKGLNDYAAAGILGNLQAESGIDPAKAQSGGGPGRGIAQWEVGGRYGALVSFAAARGTEWSNLESQLEFIWYELNGGDSTTLYILNKNYGGIEGFANAKSVEWATEAFEKSFERAGIVRMDLRIRYAREHYNSFAGSGSNGSYVALVSFAAAWETDWRIAA